MIPVLRMPFAAQPSNSLPGTEQERRSFEFFRRNTGPRIFTAFRLVVSHHLILQACHTDIAVRSAVVALGAMGQRLLINDKAICKDERANAHQQFSYYQYYKALRHLRQQIIADPQRSVDSTLMSCFLFTCFESIRGNDAGLLVHLRCGLDILRRNHGALLIDPSSDRIPLRQELITTFSQMDIDCTMYLDERSLSSPAIPLLDSPNHSPLSSQSFSSLEDAAESLNFQMRRIYYFRRRMAVSSGTRPYTAVSEQQDLSLELDEWTLALEALSMLLGNVLSMDMMHRITVMKMNHLTTQIVLAAVLQEDKDRLYRESKSKFLEIVSLAQSVVKPPNDASPVEARVQRIIAANSSGTGSSPAFALYAGLVHPLHITAIKCQDIDISRKALWLMLDEPWREKTWDSATMARLAKRKVQKSEDDGYLTTVEFAKGVKEVPVRPKRYDENLLFA